MSDKLLLSILIPTKNREKNLSNTLRRLTKSIKNSGINSNSIEVIVADNFSNDGTKNVVQGWIKKHSYIKYFKQEQQYFSVEESLFNGLKFASGEYVWTIGDDDFVAYDSVKILTENLKNTDAKFILLNCDILTPDRKKTIYMRCSSELVEYESGLDFFSDFGITNTTISCLCFKRDALDKKLFDELRSISPIYSRSCTFLASFHNKKCAFLSTPIITYRENKLAIQYKENSKSQKNNAQPDLFSFTNGLIDLLLFLEKRISIPLEKLIKLEEMELSRDSWRVKHSLLYCFIGTFVIKQIRSLVAENHVNDFYKQEIEKFLTKCHDFFSRLENEDVFIPEFLDYILHLKESLQSKSWKRHFAAFAEAETLQYLEDKFYKIEANFFLKKDNKISTSNQAILCFKDSSHLKFLRNKAAEISGSKTNLTILVPTYNRAPNLFFLLSRMIQQKIDTIKDVEILIAVNKCSDETYEVCDLFKNKMPNLRIKKFDDFVDSAEENINRATQYCSGKYIFILGDDDLLLFHPFCFALALTRNSNAPAIILNNAFESDVSKKDLNGVDVKGRFAFQHTIDYRDFSYLARDWGVTICMAFISRYIIRKDLFLSMEKHIKISKIYSHVFAFLDFFRGKKVLLVDLPLVARGDSVVQDRFETLKKKENINQYYYWTVGLLLHFENVIKSGIADSSWFFKIKEYSPPMGCFYLWKEICAQLCKQSILYLKTKDDCEKPSIKAKEILNGFSKSKLKGRDAEILNNFLEKYEKICQLDANRLSEESAKNHIKEFQYLLDRIASNDNLLLNYIAQTQINKPKEKLKKIRRKFFRSTLKRTASVIRQSRKAISVPLVGLERKITRITRAIRKIK